MAVLWSVLKAQIGRRLQDPSHNRYGETLLLDAINDALLAFAASHTGAASTFEIEGDGETYEFSLPSDIIEEESAGVYAVHWKYNEWLRMLEYWPGSQWASTSRSTTSTPLGYILWPQGKISFSRVPEDEQVITVYYVAYYPAVVNDDSVITVPKWAEEALKCYACALALEPGSTKAGNLAQYKQRRDSGDPEDNPLLELSKYYMDRFWQILSTHRTPQYVKLQPAGG